MNSEHIPICYTVDKMGFIENAHFRLGIGLGTPNLELDCGVINCNDSKGVYFKLQLDKFYLVLCLWR